MSLEFFQQYVVDDAGRERLEAGLSRFGLSLQHFGKVLTKTNTLSLEFFQQYVVDDAGRQDLAIGCAHFGLTLLQFGIILCTSNCSGGFIKEYIVNSSKWHCVQRLDTFTKSDVSTKSLARQGAFEPTQTSSPRLAELSQMEPCNRPHWDELATELDELCLIWWRTRLSDTNPHIVEDISNTTIKLLLRTRPDPTTGKFLRYSLTEKPSELLDKARKVMGVSPHSESSFDHVEDTQRPAGSKRKRCPESDNTAAGQAHTTTALDAAEETVKSLEFAIDEALVQKDFSKLQSLGIRILKMRTLKDTLIAAQKRSDVNTMVYVSHEIMQLQSE